MKVAIASPLSIRDLEPVLGLRPEGSDTIPSGSGGHSVTELVAALSWLGVELHLVTLEVGLSAPVTLKGHGVTVAVHPCRPRARHRARDLFAKERAAVRNAVEHGNPDLAHAHWTYEYALGSLATRLPTLVTVRDWGPSILWHQRDAYRLVRLVMQGLTFLRGRHFTAVSPYIARRVERLVRRSTPVIPNLLGDAWFRSTARPAPSSRRIILAVNNGFMRRKNAHTLLIAFTQVRHRHPSSELWLAGIGYEQGGPAHQWAVDRHADQGVRFMGPMTREVLPDLYDQADLFVHPSVEESFGMVVAEAMARGLPVVGGRKSGAVPWVLADGEAGRLTDVTDASQLSDAILALLGDTQEWSCLSQAALDHARATFSARAVAEQYVEIYQQMLQKEHRQ